MRLTVYNEHLDKKIKLTVKPDRLTVVTGRNGHGKTSLLAAVRKHLSEQKIPCIQWDDMEYGRSRGVERLMMNNDYESLAEMTFHSEGESIMASFGRFFMGSIARKVRALKKGDKLVLLADQLDSGLDAHQLCMIKEVIRDTVIPDAEQFGVELYILFTANSYELANREDCVDAITGKHYTFCDFESYAEYIDSQYQNEEGEIL